MFVYCPKTSSVYIMIDRSLCVSPNPTLCTYMAFALVLLGFCGLIAIVDIQSATLASLLTAAWIKD